MITEDYVSFETSKLLKEKGFEQECHTAYFNGARVDYTMFGFCIGDDFVYAPTLQTAMKWLREVYNIDIVICVVDHSTITMEQNYYFYRIFVNRRQKYDDNPLFHTYEEACEAAIKYCLENLI